MNKLYIVVRGDLKPGLQVAQSCHALRLFSEEHPEEDRRWYDDSNNLVVLQVPSKECLAELAYNAQKSGVRLSCFKEPDLQNELTAVALDAAARKLVQQLPLALCG